MENVRYSHASHVRKPPAVLPEGLHDWTLRLLCHSSLTHANTAVGAGFSQYNQNMWMVIGSETTGGVSFTAVRHQRPFTDHISQNNQARKTEDRFFTTVHDRNTQKQSMIISSRSTQNTKARKTSIRSSSSSSSCRQANSSAVGNLPLGPHLHPPFLCTLASPSRFARPLVVFFHLHPPFMYTLPPQRPPALFLHLHRPFV